MGKGVAEACVATASVVTARSVVVVVASGTVGTAGVAGVAGVGIAATMATIAPVATATVAMVAVAAVVVTAVTAAVMAVLAAVATSSQLPQLPQRQVHRTTAATAGVVGTPGMAGMAGAMALLQSRCSPRLTANQATTLRLLPLRVWPLARLPGRMLTPRPLRHFACHTTRGAASRAWSGAAMWHTKASGVKPVLDTMSQHTWQSTDTADHWPSSCMPRSSASWSSTNSTGPLSKTGREKVLPNRIDSKEEWVHAPPP